MLHSVMEESEGVDCAKNGVPMFHQFFQMATNIVTRLTFGKRMFGSSVGSDFRETVAEVFRLFGVFNIGDFIPSLKRFDLQVCTLSASSYSFVPLSIFCHHDIPDKLLAFLECLKYISSLHRFGVFELS